MIEIKKRELVNKKRGIKMNNKINKRYLMEG
jgi:hypothetical protein